MSADWQSRHLGDDARQGGRGMDIGYAAQSALEYYERIIPGSEPSHIPDLGSLNELKTWVFLTRHPPLSAGGRCGD